MKFKIFFTIALVLSLLAGLYSCHKVADLTPSTSSEGINSLTASFANDSRAENAFSSEIDHQNGIITVVFPYNYPRLSDTVLTMSNLTNVRVKANLDNNVTASPNLLYLDFTKDNYITVTDQAKKTKQYKIVAEIRKSNEAFITTYELPFWGLSGVIDDNNKMVSLISLDSIGVVLANLSISHGATISPDPSATAMSYENAFQVTVTAQNGVTQNVYTIKKAIPSKTALGIRPGSAKVLWAKKLDADLGISALNLTTGIAATKDYLVINTRAQNSIYLNKNTGQIVGTINLGSVVGSLVNFYNTADENDNILLCNLNPNVTPFQVWRITGVTGTPIPYITWTTSEAVGRKLSIKGNLDGDAIITAALLGTGNRFARWVVTGGVLQSQTPEIVAISGIGAAWNNNADVVQTDATNTSSDYFVTYYAAPYKFAWVDGVTNTVKAFASALSQNWVSNAADYTVFNNCPYAVQNSVNSQTFGLDDVIYLYDVSSVGTFGASVWSSPAGIYGGKENAGLNGNGTGDVALQVSDNGYYMYLYFMFTNGQVVCVQFDCFDL
jgi:hypothetical protein